MPDTTTTPTPIPDSVTSQDLTSPASSQDNLDAQHSADTFKALSALFDETTTPTTSTPTTATPTTTDQTKPSPPTPTPVGTETPTPGTPQPDAFEKSLDEIKPAERAHPNVQKGMDELRRISREEHKRAAELEVQLKDTQTKIAEYETKLKTPTIPEDVKNELETLRTMRKELDLRLDPEFNKKYVQPVQSAESSIISALKEAGLREETAKEIADNGGLIAMARSNKVIDPKTGMTAQQWVDEVLLAKTPSFYRDRVKGELIEAMRLQDTAQRELTEFQGKAKERWESKMQKLTEDFNTGRDAAIAELGEIAKLKDVPPTATAEERAAIEAHNTRIKTAATKFDEYMKSSQDPKIAGAIMVKATQADALLEANKELEAKVASLQDRLTKIQASGSLSQAGDHSPPPGTPTQTKPQDLLKQSDSQALGDLLNKAGITR